MQFYLDGYEPGGSVVGVRDEAGGRRADDLPAEADVLIVGAGPAGLVLAALLANFPDITTVVVDRAEGPLLLGQADGVACRTVEVLEAFGLADRILGEAYWVNEVCFWGPDPAHPERIIRTGRVPDTDETISEMPHVTVNQARLLAYLRDYMARSPSGLRPIYGHQVEAVRVSSSDDVPHPVEVTIRPVAAPSSSDPLRLLRARYVVGCDGARSTVRRQIARELIGDITDTSWGVMDVLGVTDFPDIRMKSVIKSASGGNILVIPREGGYLVRLYIEIPSSDSPEDMNASSTTREHLIEILNRSLHPYSFDVKQVGWWSVYTIGQRLCDRFDDLPASGRGEERFPRVFIAGDACHTHSAKAGQGMNVSIADAWNLGWKLAGVVRGRARPELLHTYSAERQPVARRLIEFDRQFSQAMSARPEVVAETGESNRADAVAYQDYFAQQLRFTSGTDTCYDRSIITAAPSFQHLATGYPIGMRFQSARVVRAADARQVELGHVVRADGAWRLFLFGDRSAPEPGSQLHACCEYLGSRGSPLQRFTRPGEAPDSVIDVRAVLSKSHREVALDRLPPVLLPGKGRFQLIDYEKVFCAIPGEKSIFRLRGIDAERGCAVVVRPDQFVAHVLPLDAFAEITEIFAGVLM